MHYVFDATGECIAATTYKPDQADIASRHCVSIESDVIYGPFEIALTADRRIASREEAMATRGRGSPLARAITKQDEAIQSTKLANLMLSVNQAIAPLSDAAEYGMASASELARLNALKMYRIKLMRIKASPGWPSNVTWPTAPI